MAEFAVLCPGQGAQSATMLDLAVAEPDGLAVVDAFAQVLQIDLLQRVRADDRLFENAFAQAAMVAAAIAIWRILAPRLPAPALFAGYSVGEVSAWACAGLWDPANAAALVAARAGAMDRYSPPDCGMLAVRGLPRAEIEALAVPLDVAIVNEDDHVVLAGPNDAIDDAVPRLTAAGAWSRRLDVRVPSHTPLLRHAADAFGRTLADTPRRAVTARVLRGIDGVACLRGDDAVEALPRAIRETIRWDACCCALEESGVRVALELGPGRSLAALCATNCPGIVVRSTADFRSIAGIESWLLRSLDA